MGMLLEANTPLGLQAPSRERDFPIIPVELWHVANLDVVGNNWASLCGNSSSLGHFSSGSSKETKSDYQMEQDRYAIKGLFEIRK
jgi:hypothetical protein